jgi:hypothetical protein
MSKNFVRKDAYLFREIFGFSVLEVNWFQLLCPVENHKIIPVLNQAPCHEEVW